MGPTSLSALLLWVRTLTRSAHVNGSAMLECRAALISGYTPMGQVSALGATAFSINVSVKLFVCSLMFVF